MCVLIVKKAEEPQIKSLSEHLPFFVFPVIFVNDDDDNEGNKTKLSEVSLATETHGKENVQYFFLHFLFNTTFLQGEQHSNFAVQCISAFKALISKVE